MLLRLENEIFWLCYCSMKRIYYILCCYLQVFVIISLKYSSHSTTKIILYSCYFNTDPLFTLFVFWIFLFQKRRIIIKIIIPYTVRLLMLFNTLEIIYKSALFVFQKKFKHIFCIKINIYLIIISAYTFGGSSSSMSISIFFLQLIISSNTQLSLEQKSV